MLQVILVSVIAGAIAGRLAAGRSMRAIRCRAAHRRRHGRAHRYFRLLRSLGLSSEQKRAARDIFRELRDTVQDSRAALREEVDPLLATLAEDEFDRAAVEDAAVRQDESYRRLRTGMVATLERLHDLLTPEQRERLRSALRVTPGTPAPAGGPYR